MAQIDNNNAQKEFYLTDVVALAVDTGTPVTTVTTDATSVHGINNRVQLAQAERVYQARIAEQLMLAGVTLRDPARFDIRSS